jgi:acyl dehydratase
MPLNQSFVGREYPPTPPYEVGREKIREFADATGASEAAYRDPAAAGALGHPDVIAPPTFPIVVTLPAGRQIIDDPELGIDYSRVVHGDQRFKYTRPVTAGDRLSCVCVVDEITSRAGNDFLTTRTEVGDEHGGHVVTVWTKLVVRASGAGQ